MKIKTSIGTIKARKSTFVKLENILLEASELNMLFNKKDTAKEQLEVYNQINKALIKNVLIMDCED